MLNLPRVGRDDSWELLLGATGPFVIRRANGILTSARCCELLNMRRAGMLGTLQEYHELCHFLPQVFASLGRIVSILVFVCQSLSYSLCLTVSNTNINTHNIRSEESL